MTRTSNTSGPGRGVAVFVGVAVLVAVLVAVAVGLGGAPCSSVAESTCSVAPEAAAVPRTTTRAKAVPAGETTGPIVARRHSAACPASCTVPGRPTVAPLASTNSSVTEASLSAGSFA